MTERNLGTNLQMEVRRRESKETGDGCSWAGKQNGKKETKKKNKGLHKREDWRENKLKREK